jgi:EmrB/QacA subfamily drug resistance transporter
MLSLFLASMEGTVVATAMPSIVSQLGGLSIYSWVFSVYMLTSTTTVPIYGKLSDLYGRKLIYAVSMTLFLIGSILCGLARNMEQLIIFRAIQGLGAGGVLPLAFTIIGELFTLEQRARMQGLLSGVWGVSSIIGPLIGGFLVDQVSWHWVFYINVIPGIFALGLVWFSWKDIQYGTGVKVAVDYGGALFLTVGALCLLYGMSALGTNLGWWSLAGSIAFFTGLVWIERRAADPILPLSLLRDRLFVITLVHGFFSGWAVFGSISYVPLFVQAVLGTSATQAGISLTPMSLGWTLASIFGSRLLLRMEYRTLALFGMIILVAGTFFMTQVSIQTSFLVIMVNMSLMGIGMVQSTVRKSELGMATSSIQFSRSIGGTIGVSVLGVTLSTRLANHLLSGGLDPALISLNSLLDPLARVSAAINTPLRQSLALSIAEIFIIAFAAGLVGLLSVMVAPGGKIAQLMQDRPLDRSPEV